MQEKENCCYFIDIRTGHRLLGYLIFVTILKEVYDIYWLWEFENARYAYLLTVLSTLWLAYAYASWFHIDRPLSRARIVNAWIIYLVCDVITSVYLIWYIKSLYKEEKQEVTEELKPLLVKYDKQYTAYSDGIK